MSMTTPPPIPPEKPIADVLAECEEALQRAAPWTTSEVFILATRHLPRLIREVRELQEIQLLDVHAICDQRDKAVADRDSLREQLAESQATIRGLKDSIHEHIDADRIRGREIQQLRAQLQQATKERDEALAKLKEVQPDVAYVMRYDEQKDEMLYEPPDKTPSLQAQLTAEITHSNKLAEALEYMLHNAWHAEGCEEPCGCGLTRAETKAKAASATHATRGKGEKEKV